jgi:hypothetical protein
MTREEKIATISEVCRATNKVLQAEEPVRLRHILRAFYVNKVKYWVGAAGHFIDPVSLAATDVRWQARQNELVMQDDDCIDFLYQVFRAE